MIVQDSPADLRLRGSGRPRLVHVSSIHRRTDTRIRVKECATLARRFDAEVVFLVCDDLPDEVVGGVRVVSVGAPAAGSRVGRMVESSQALFRRLLELRPDAMHFHDPELIPLGIALRARGTQVFYDVHEDLPRQVAYKGWIPGPVRPGVAGAAGMLEWVAARGLSGIVAATPRIEARFPPGKTVLVRNFPIVAELEPSDGLPHGDRPPWFGYVGGILDVRGAREMVDAMAALRGVAGGGGEDERPRLRMAGAFHPPGLEAEVRSRAGWGEVDFLGWADRGQVRDLLTRVRAGLVLLHPVENLLHAYPVKLFEYMAAGLPVIASDFPEWRALLAGVDCARFVDPLDPAAIAREMAWILAHPDEAQAMGARGRSAVVERLNWAGEADALEELYRSRVPGLSQAARGDAGLREGPEE